ncbi:hypothetical protein [Mycobacterium sp. 852014-52144_SCH5372336]|uniref:hypothetical protein n=1 Tax=Mycobacterium sp. 852014-52144_SCH5372336 TaxID=1834115 RepID=UPI0007FFDF3B|nr:hypothetical protein [Mycobacterium sp. 852014-52144_SCH5372336]OBB75897.1 hypothetical protein A5759_06535 [Mycobacterium sp. 852014-52144_SCH5372336]
MALISARSDFECQRRNVRVNRRGGEEDTADAIHGDGDRPRIGQVDRDSLRRPALMGFLDFRRGMNDTADVDPPLDQCFW